ncbi:helix-turn-helix domain-containing protein [Nocardia sp. ET3-3]|uniref:Helix-turn-helix domain-containing protein n=1 Tax=Nocardia terrae TaxID=2675851 RepID=A0A7K1V3Q6_9NOCA|nr:winged helix-turn-helix domain-containing protein [Nocardia terrae]MVU81270.1 helix-turn-helix domain-containing protein [Nocardia terrae]
MADEPRTEFMTDIAALRLMAHPLRRRIEEQLRGGPVNATSLAKELGESTGLTSYHLRQMAKHGFVEEVSELSTGKERWWRAVPRDRRWPRYSEQDDEMRAASAEITRQHVAEVVDLYESFERHAHELGSRADVFTYSRATIRVDRARFEEFFEAYIDLVQRFEAVDEEGDDDQKSVLLRMFSFPEIDPAR